MRTAVGLFVFDLDGTLIDTMGGFADIAGRLIRDHYGWAFELARKRYLETSGAPFFQQLETLFPAESRNQAVAEAFEQRKVQHFIKARPSEQAVSTLQRLRDLEVRTAISSNNFDDLVKEFVRRENVPVDLALGYRSGFAKGAEHFAHLRDYFGVSGEQMVFVGDSLTDATRARESGIRFVARLGTFTAADFEGQAISETCPVINEIHELLDLLEDL